MHQWAPADESKLCVCSLKEVLASFLYIYPVSSVLPQWSARFRVVQLQFFSLWLEFKTQANPETLKCEAQTENLPCEVSETEHYKSRARANGSHVSSTVVGTVTGQKNRTDALAPRLPMCHACSCWRLTVESPGKRTLPFPWWWPLWVQPSCTNNWSI